MGFDERYRREKIRANADAFAWGCMVFTLVSCGAVAVLALVLM